MGLIYLDSCLLIYLIENHSQWAAPLRSKLSAVDPLNLAISDLVRMECLVKPIRDDDLALQRRYRNAFEELVQLPLSREVFESAAHLRGRFGIKPPDALHLACAQHHGCEQLWTNDERLTAAGHGLARQILE